MLHDRQTQVVQSRAALANIRGTSGDIASRSGVLPQDVEAASVALDILKKYGAQPAAQVIDIVSKSATREQISQATTALGNVLDNALNNLWDDLRQLFRVDRAVSHGVIINSLTMQELANWSRQMSGRINDLEQWIGFHSIQSQLSDRGLSGIFDEVLFGNVKTAEVVEAFRSTFYRQWLDAAYEADPVLKKFQVHEHEALLDAFRNLDRDSIDGAYKRIRAKLLESPERPRIGAISAPATSELGILLREASRKRPRMPLRQLFGKIPQILLRLKPCVMMSPLAVSTFLDSPDLEFDIVIFDEASQVRPYDAVGAVYRGKQLLVAGDQKQLPPTSFFDALDIDRDRDVTDDEDDYAGSMSDFESILDKCCSLGMPRKRLRWHYRSRRESLITFSNRFIYNNELITFPSVLDTEGSSAVVHHYVPSGRWVPRSSGSGCNPVEADELVRLIVQQLEQEPDSSLADC